MGNNVAKEFQATKLCRGSLDGTEAELIAPEMVIRGKKATTIVEEDIYEGHAGKNNQLMARQFINQDTKEMLFQVGYKLKSSSNKQVSDMYAPRSIATSDRNRVSILYVDKEIVTRDGQKRTMLYKTCPVYPNQPAAKKDDMIVLEMKKLYLAAVIFDCRHQANHNAACAYLCVVTGANELDDTGFELLDLYRAIKIPNVKNGVLVVDMNGRPVGKSATVPKGGPCSFGSSFSLCDASISTSSRTSSLSSSRSLATKTFLEESSTAYEIAPGADAAAVIAVASSLF